MKIFCNFHKFKFSNFKTIPDTLEGCLNNGKERYKPTVSDVSYCELVAPTDSMEKALNSAHENTFGIFKAITARKVARDVIRQKCPGITVLNSPQTDKEMLDLGKKRWVCVLQVSIKFMLLCEKIRKFSGKLKYGTRKVRNQLRFLHSEITLNLSYFPASKSLPKQK